MFRLTRLTILILAVLNIVVGAVLLLILGYSLINTAAATELLARTLPAAHVTDALVAVQIALSLVVPVMIAAHLIFGRLLAMLDSAASGDPFVAANGSRLRAIGWALLAIQICDLVFGAVMVKFAVALGDQGTGWAPSITGWLAVLLVFVLARIFEQGARMRDDLALTV